jgi:hypothetical protein
LRIACQSSAFSTFTSKLVDLISDISEMTNQTRVKKFFLSSEQFRFLKMSKQQIPRFSVKDEKELQSGLKYLSDQGFVIWDARLEIKEIDRLKDMFGTWAQEAIPGYNKEKHVFEKDRQDWLPSFSGIIESRGIGQSDFMWACRTLPQFRTIYEAIYKTDELFVSFDGCNASIGQAPYQKSYLTRL